MKIPVAAATIWATFAVVEAAFHRCPPRCQCERSEEIGIVVDCADRSFTRLPTDFPPGTVSLDLSSNLLQTLPNDTFKILPKLKVLKLKNNSLQGFEPFAFRGLYALEYLDLGGNQLSMTPSVYTAGLFRDLHRLTSLNLCNNVRSWVNKSLAYPDRTLRDLKSLQKLCIDALQNLTLGSGFDQLLHLTALHLRNPENNGSRSVGCDTFRHCGRLKCLNISYLNIDYIDENALMFLPDLETLDISGNTHLGLDRAASAFKGLHNSKKIRRIFMNFLVPRFSIGTELKQSHIEPISNTSLEEIYLDSNLIELVEDGALNLAPKTLQVVTVQDNRFTFGNYLFEIQSMSSLRYIDASYLFATHPILNRLNTSSRGGASSEIRHRGTWISFHFPPKLETIIYFYCKLNYHIPAINFMGTGTKFVNISRNLFTSWGGPIKGAESLAVLDMSMNACDMVSSDFFSFMTGLRMLFLSNNNLYTSLQSDENGKIFGELEILETLDLASNKIRYLPRNIFRGLPAMRHLNLSDNYLADFVASIDRMRNLSFLDLSNNSLSGLTSDVRSALTLLHGRNGTLAVDLSHNKLRCSCENVEFLKWLQDHRGVFVGLEAYRCTYSNRTSTTLKHLNGIVSYLEKKCASYLLLIVVSVTALAFFVAVLLGGLVYRFRWKLRYLYHLAKSQRRGYAAIDDDDDFVFDAFVSYEERSLRFVRRQMIERLEQRNDVKLCVHHRDFLPGEDIATNILTAIHTSRKTLVLLTRPYLQSYWCVYEFNMARHEQLYSGRAVLVVAMMEDIPTDLMPRELLSTIQSQSFLEYTEDPDGQLLFWENLQKALTTR